MFEGVEESGENDVMRQLNRKSAISSNRVSALAYEDRKIYSSWSSPSVGL